MRRPTNKPIFDKEMVLVVAHRLSTISHLDRILVFHHGEIVEDGSHADLLALKGAYHRLWQMQDAIAQSTRQNTIAQSSRQKRDRPTTHQKVQRDRPITHLTQIAITDNLG
jgi:ABC-type multidrug transport system ATPase subunit